MKKKILVVDDNKVLLKLMENLLSKEGYQVWTVQDGLSALDILKVQSPDFIFIDLVMPGIDGKKLCQVIREMDGFKDVYMAILSASLAEEKIDMVELGVDALIAKNPFSRMGQDILYVLREPGAATSRCLSGEIIGIEGIYPRDMTRELLSLKNHFHRIMDKMPQGIMELTADGRIFFTNPAALSLVSIAEAQLLGTHFAHLFEGDDRRRVEALLNPLNGQTGCIPYEGPATLNWHLISLELLLHPTDVETSLSVVMTDITRQKREEAILKVMLQMAGATAHEFNQPLTALLGNVELLEMSCDDPKVVTECLRDIKRAGKRIAETVKKVQNIRHYETKPYGTRSSIVNFDQDINILSIEDSDRYFGTIQTVLLGMDHVNLMRAKTILSAIPQLTEGKIDLILLDYVLPDGNAFDFMTKAREKGIETPVVVLTGEGDEMIASRLIQQGACDYMTKDFFNGERISRSIWHVLEKTRLKNEIGAAQDRITQMAVMDSLTGLHNRRYLFDALDREKKRAQRYGADLVVCMIDLDHFKRINDTFGHTAGDTVLSEIGRLLLQWARETDLPCRYGGEEFAVILPETSLEGGRMACERLRRMVAQHRFDREGAPLNVTVSIGIALYDKAVEQTVSDLINNADEALYRAKEEGRNRVNLNLQTGVP